MTIAIRLTLSWWHQQVLRFLAERGGEAEYNFGRMVVVREGSTEEERIAMVKSCDQGIRDMADPLKLNVITATPVLGNLEKVLLRLTDAGRQVIQQMGLVVKLPTAKFDLKTGAEILGTGEKD